LDADQGQDGDYWIVDDLGLAAVRHPAAALDDDDHLLLQLWAAWRNHGHLPEAGPVLDQPEATMASLRYMEGCFARLKEARRSVNGTQNTN